MKLGYNMNSIEELQEKLIEAMKEGYNCICCDTHCSSWHEYLSVFYVYKRAKSNKRNLIGWLINTLKNERQKMSDNYDMVRRAEDIESIEILGYRKGQKKFYELMKAEDALYEDDDSYFKKGNKKKGRRS